MPEMARPSTVAENGSEYEAPPNASHKRQSRRGDRDGRGREHQRRRIDHLGAGSQRLHADVMHRNDAEPHEHGGGADARQCRRTGARGKNPRPDHDHADKERQQGRQDEVVDRKRNALRQHADEMHRPDAEREGDRCAGKKSALPRPFGAGGLNREAQPDIGALDRERDRERYQPWRVRHRHRPPSLIRLRRPDVSSSRL